MKKLMCILSFLLLTGATFSQTEFRASMGIDFISAPSLVDFLNRSYASSFDEVSTFNSSAVFSVEGGFFINESYQIGLDLSYLINSFTFTSDLGSYDLSYRIVTPALMNYYVLQGAGYEFKFGGGIGIPLLFADEKIWGYVSSVSYNSTGLGFLLRADGNTILSGNVYVNVGVDVKYQLIGKPKDGNNFLGNNIQGENPDFNSLSLGIHLGLTYRF